MDILLSALRVSGFEAILEAYAASGTPMKNALDGGAGSGQTSEVMAKHLAPGGVVHAFEPFPGNHRFFAERDPRVILHKKALSAAPGSVPFHVPAVVAEDSAWGRRGLAGYSSGGRIAKKDGGHNYDVEAVPADVYLSDEGPIDFVKLDLEGGEVDAMKGMPKIIDGARLFWIEFKGQPDLLSSLVESGMLLFDTSYLFYGDPSEEALKLFEPERTKIGMSNGRTAWTGFRKVGWNAYLSEFADCAKRFNMIQTDLVCVNRRHLREFTQALARL